ncbi:MAG: hypothetical protein LBK44_02885 [Spirochaetales bacterium]|jgi:hypothetical protein|nr:hypothetical protein [Spirochaetales bacterium]
MRFLWAFRYNPLRGGSSKQGPAIAGARNCRWQFHSSNHSVAIVEQLRDVPPSFFAVRRKKTHLYHRHHGYKKLSRLQVCHQARSVAECTSLSPTGCRPTGFSSFGKGSSSPSFASSPLPVFT